MQRYPVAAIKDRKLEREFWESKEGFLETVGEFMNNLYLKLSGIKEGTENYGDPSKYTTETKVVDNIEVEVVTVYYSDTARMILQIGLSRSL